MSTLYFNQYNSHPRVNLKGCLISPTEKRQATRLWKYMEVLVYLDIFLLKPPFSIFVPCSPPGSLEKIGSEIRRKGGGVILSPV